MNEMKMSKFLSQIMNDSKKIGNKKNAPFTAERFLVAMIDRIMVADGSKDDELFAVKNILEKAITDLKAAQDSLMEYVCRENSNSFLDDLYMKKKLKEAFDLVSKIGDSEVDSIALVLRITVDPSDAIKKVMNLSSEKIIADEKEPEHNTSVFEKPLVETEKKLVKSELKSLVREAKQIGEELRTSIFGQDNAINVFTTGYFQANMSSIIDKTRSRPRATFLFAGPPGVGKTFLSEKVAQALKLPFMRFDMSEYADKEAYLEFCGSDKVYKNAKAGNVTSFVAENPKCVLLFDEIEKAHISVIHLFLQMLDAGRLRDSYTDEEVSFSETIVILTTNAGKQLYEDNENNNFASISRKVIIKALQTDVNPETGIPFFPSAICSRFASGNVVMFNHIGANDLQVIAKKAIERQAKSLEKETGIKLKIDEQVYTALLFSEGGSADARTIRSRAETFFNEELYELLRLVSSNKVRTDIDDIESINIGIDLKQANSNIAELFSAASSPKVLVFADDETVNICKTKAPKIDFVGTYDVEKAVEILKNQSIDFILINMKKKTEKNSCERLNIEDTESPTRDFWKITREREQLFPVYILEDSDLSEEEKTSFIGQGARGILSFTRSNNTFETRLRNIANSLHWQSSINKLKKENKVVRFESAQTISKNGKNAKIKLFDFKTVVAVESEDAKDVLNMVSTPNVHFDDVIGAQDAKKELTYFVEYLKNSKKYIGTGVKAPKGVILYGPPGTGKTMLAKAMACESNVTFIAAEGNQFLKKYVGEGSEQVHKLFKTARKYAPSILFIDEIDAIAKERKGSAQTASNGEETLTAFLTEMDGFSNDPSRPVFVLAATNFNVEPGSDKSLDPALMRRFDRRVYIDLPNREERTRFLKMKIESNSALEISPEQIENISMRSTGMSLAELDSVVELALRSAIREGSAVVNDKIFEEAFETFNSGEVKKWDVSQLQRVARHESGHALLCYLSGETPSYLTIVARGNHGGYMQHADNEGKAIYTKNELLAKIRTSLGGRAAEIVYYGKQDGVSTGASGDLANATKLAEQLVCKYGMDDDFGLSVVGSTALNSEISVEIKNSINRILKEQMEKAITLISENKDKIDSLVEELMLKNHLNATEIEQAIIKKRMQESSKISKVD